MGISIHQGSILDAKVDYVVNPANSFLNHAGGLANIIARHATAQFAGDPVNNAWAEHNAAVNQWVLDHERAPLISTGSCHLTSSGALPFKGVYHAVGPIWNGGSYYERELLEMAYESVYRLLPQDASVAFPAISAGIFGVPIVHVADIAVQVARWYEDDFETEFWLFTDDHREAFEKALST